MHFINDKVALLLKCFGTKSSTSTTTTITTTTSTTTFNAVVCSSYCILYGPKTVFLS